MSLIATYVIITSKYQCKGCQMTTKHCCELVDNFSLALKSASNSLTSGALSNKSFILMKNQMEYFKFIFQYVKILCYKNRKHTFCKSMPWFSRTRKFEQSFFKNSGYWVLGLLNVQYGWIRGLIRIGNY